MRRRTGVAAFILRDMSGSGLVSRLTSMHHAPSRTYAALVGKNVATCPCWRARLIEPTTEPMTSEPTPLRPLVLPRIEAKWLIIGASCALAAWLSLVPLGFLVWQSFLTPQT